MRTLSIDEELLEYSNDYFPEYDFLYMLFHISVVMFLLMSISRILSVELGYSHLTETNLTFYLSMATCV
jgi:hypothetical protein